MSAAGSEYPKSIILADGAEIRIERMTAADRDVVLEFAAGLSEEDMLFLRVDITQPEVVDNWMASLESGHAVSLAAYDDQGLIGYATVHRNPAPWTRRVGEIRVNVDSRYRERRLGKNLISEIFALARALGSRK